MVQRNPDVAKLAGNYLFPEVTKRRKAFLERHPEAKLISLGIGDTTQPIPPSAMRACVEAAERLGVQETYTGYGAEQGLPLLRQRISDRLYHGRVDSEDVYVSDGAKCDLARLFVLFGRHASVALQDPAYPAYVDSAVLYGLTADYDSDKQGYGELAYLPCTADNEFFPDLSRAPRTDLIYFCSPNNPTGAVATREQLTQLVAFAHRNRSIILFDTAYAPFINDNSLPKSIYEIDGAHEVAIEIGSFSKLAGFTGVRLGWTVVPKQLLFDDGRPIKADWHRIVSTIYNGASNIAQAGGAALLTDKGLEEIDNTVSYYRENARILREVLRDCGIKAYSGDHAPYLWVQFPGKGSWQVFEWLLNEAWLVTTPGVGFGPAGEGFVRFSALGQRADVLEAAERIKKL
jgi:LL-diaminopimelate aminotransferase